VLFALRLQIAVLFLLTGRGALKVILGVSMSNVSVPQEMTGVLRLTGKITNVLSLMMTIILKATVALCWNLILALRPSVLLTPRPPPVFVEMV